MGIEADFFAQAENLKVGKRVGGAIYLHRILVQDELSVPASLLESAESKIPDWNCIKLSKKEETVSFLNYLDFDTVQHPILAAALTCHVGTGRSRLVKYDTEHNPPILHRKELLIGPNDPRFDLWAEITREEESLGLYDETKTIGFLRNWEKLLSEKQGGGLERSQEKTPQVDRHKTAISRTSASKPVQTLLSTGILSPTRSFFDYGCGKGDDLDFLQSAGFRATGWDPVHRPHGQKIDADVVNLGFVLNVIEDSAERVEVLKRAFALTRSVLCVSTLIENQQTAINLKPYKDGFLTSRNTFQKYFRQAELAQLLEDALEHPTAALGPGIFFVFKKSEEAEEFFVTRNRRQTVWTDWGIRTSWTIEERTKLKKDKFFAAHEATIERYWNTTMDLGRFPVPEEFPELGSLLTFTGAQKRLQAWMIEHFGQDAFQKAITRKRDDVIVYLALRHFQKRLPLKKLPQSVQRDIQATFPNFEIAWETARNQLFKIGKPEAITELCNKTTVGRLDEQALFVSPAEVQLLDAVLRIYVETGELFYGDRFQADDIKIHKASGKVTFLTYHEPKLEKKTWLRTKVGLANQRVEFYDHTIGRSSE